MKQFNLRTGKLGEKIAGDYLQKQGYKIIERGYRTKYGEIDLICQKGKELVIIEVRTKIGEGFGTPEESLTKKKIKKICQNVLAYVAKNSCSSSYRADAICIVLNPDLTPQRVTHYENVV